MSSSNFVSIQKEDYLLGPAWVRKSFRTTKSSIDGLSVGEIFDFIPYTLQELEPAVERGASLAATGHRRSQHYRQILYHKLFLCTPSTYACLLQK